MWRDQIKVGSSRLGLDGLCQGHSVTWFKVPSKNIKSESGAERLGLVSMHAGEVRGAVLDLFGTLSSL